MNGLSVLGLVGSALALIALCLFRHDMCKRPRWVPVLEDWHRPDIPNQWRAYRSWMWVQQQIQRKMEEANGKTT